MANYFRPGVYIEEVPSLPPSVIPVETAIPAFIGYTGTPLDPSVNQADLLLRPKKIFSMVEYQQYFGLPDPEKTGITVNVKKDENGEVITDEVIAKVDESNRSKHIMNYALQAYFLNGGGPCWIVSVGSYTDSVVLGNGILDEDDTNNGLLTGLSAIEFVNEVTILVFPESSGLSTSADQKTLYDSGLAQCEKKKNRFLVTDAFPSGPNQDSVDTVASNYRNNLVGFNHLKYGAAYAPNVKTILDYSVDVTSIDVTITQAGTNTTVKLDTLKANDLALYNLILSKVNDIPIILPPSSIMAGIYVQVDQNRGVFKAPANVSLNGVIAPTVKISDAEHDKLNIDSSGKSINAIRSFAGRGVLVFGARTLAGNDNEWRYISVRRYFNFAEVSIKNTIEQFLFEPNDRNTWERVKAMISNFLTIQWQQGALVGNSAEQAFFVNVGLGSTMTPVDILEGRMNVDVGLAVVRPAEFIILKFSQLMQIS